MEQSLHGLFQILWGHLRLKLKANCFFLWQARIADINGPVGLVPSSTLEEKRKAFVPAPNDYSKSSLCKSDLQPLFISRPGSWFSFPHGAFSPSSHTSDLNIDIPVATLPGTWHHRVSGGTGWPDVSSLGLGELPSLILSFYLSVAAHSDVSANPSQRQASMLLGH